MGIALDIENILVDLVNIKSVTEFELPALDYVNRFLESNDFKVQRIQISENRYNIYCQIGEPFVCYSSHLDVVPALDHQFKAKIEDGKIIGRGSCDAKGQVVAMIFAALKLRELGFSNFGLLFVVGEEDDGIGAKTATEYFLSKNLKYKYFVNGEPTTCKLALAHKGGISFEVKTSGVSVHSGYPERGIDANLKMISIINDLLAVNFKSDPELGPTTLNIGRIDAGVAANVVSDFAKIKAQFRTVSDNQEIIKKVSEVIGDRGIVNVTGGGPVIRFKTLPGFETEVVKYFTDVPYMLPIAEEFLMYGPGSIFEAHTENEFLEISQLHKAVDGFVEIYKKLLS